MATAEDDVLDEEMWECMSCTMQSHNDHTACEMCGSERGQDAPKQDQDHRKYNGGLKNAEEEEVKPMGGGIVDTPPIRDTGASGGEGKACGAWWAKGTGASWRAWRAQETAETAVQLR